jgi:uncharacterized protein (TIGR03032 family)
VPFGRSAVSSEYCQPAADGTRIWCIVLLSESAGGASVASQEKITAVEAEAAAPPAARRPTTPVSYEHSRSLPGLLHELGISLVVSTYQAGKVFTVGSQAGELRVRFHHFEKAMGIARTPTGLAIVTHRQVWTLPAGSPELARQVGPGANHDICLLAREAHFTGPILGHDLAWCRGRLWIVNTLFNCLCTLEPGWSFVPRWRPPFISEIANGDRCHLNGLAVNESGPQFVTVLGETAVVAGWREGKRDGGCLIDVPSGEVLVRGLSMPHSPRLQAGTLWLLNSGHGRLERYDPSARRTLPVAELPGYTRGLDLYGDLAFVGLSRIRETAIFGGLPLDERRDSLRCGVAVVDQKMGQILATLFFTTGVQEIFDVRVLPGYRNPVLSGPYPDTDETETIWLVPGSPPPLPGGDVRPRPATTSGQPAAAPERPGRARPRVVIHARPEIDWHGPFVAAVAEGLRACGVPFAVTDEQVRGDAGLPLLLGTTFWREIEASGPYLLVDRCSFGDPARFVSLVRDGHGRRGDHRVPERVDATRWERHGVPVLPWLPRGERVILCGQAEPYSPHYGRIADWYADVVEVCSHFRRHPASRPNPAIDAATGGLPETRSWDHCGRAVTLNSSVAVDAVLMGIPTVTMDEAAMAWDVTAHAATETTMPDRSAWMHWLAWTQWSYDEIREGTPWPRFLD